MMFVGRVDVPQQSGLAHVAHRAGAAYIAFCRRSQDHRPHFPDFLRRALGKAFRLDAGAGDDALVEWFAHFKKQQLSVEGTNVR